MKKMRLWAVLFILVLGMAHGQDWPQWRGPNRDGKVTGFTPPKTWPGQLNPVWSVAVGKGDASPILVDGRLYVYTRQNDSEVLLCLDAKDGSEIWRSANPAPDIQGPASSHPGPRSTPTVADGRVITLGAGGILTCTDVGTGSVLWRNGDYSNVPSFYTAMSPIVVNDRCIAHLGGEEDGAVVAFDLQTGAEKWKWTGDAPTYSSPIRTVMHDREQIILYSDANLLSFDPSDGTLLWSIPAPNERRYYSCATPVADGNRILITGQGRGTLMVEIGSGPDWEVSELWSNADYGISFNTPILKEGLIYGIDAMRSCVYCLDGRTGKTAWADTTKLDRFGSLIDAGSVIFASSAKADLVVFKPSAENCIKLAHYKVSEKAVYAHPLIQGNHIFIKDEEMLTRYKL